MYNGKASTLYAMRIKQTLASIVLLLLIALPAIAGDEMVIEGKAPEDIETLITAIESHEGMPENKGSHGLSEFCYKTDAYVVYSTNLLGYGYQLSNAPPKGLVCKKSERVVESKKN